jgi:hypothetical protein
MTKIIHTKPYSNSRTNSSIEFTNLKYIDFKIFKVKKGNKILTGQDLGTINEKIKLYIYILLILILKNIRLDNFSSIYLKKMS